MAEIASRALEPAGEPSFEAPPLPVIAANSGFAGLLHVLGPARIDGQLEGEVIASGTVWIGKTGCVKARVEARQVIVAGELEGEIWATERIELLATARVTAALHTPRLVLADGCFFEGHCRAGGAAERAASEAPPRPNSAPGVP